MVTGQDMPVSEKPSAASALVEVLEGGTDKPEAEIECGPACLRLWFLMVLQLVAILFWDHGTHP